MPGKCGANCTKSRALIINAALKVLSRRIVTNGVYTTLSFHGKIKRYNLVSASFVHRSITLMQSQIFQTAGDGRFWIHEINPANDVQKKMVAMIFVAWDW